MNNNSYPLSLSAYYLDFSYPGHFNLQTRVFLTIPYSGDYIEEDKQTKLLSICFEMNSAFMTDKNIKLENDPGIKIMLDIIDLYCGKNIEEHLDFATDKENSNLNKTIFFSSEKDLYANIIIQFKNFLQESYSDNWAFFCKDNKYKYDKKTPLALLGGNKNELDFENEKINSFITESSNRLERILENNSLNYEALMKENITWKNNSFITRLFNNEEETHDEIDELININKTYLYYKLSEELTKVNTLNKKVKKL